MEWKCFEILRKNMFHHPGWYLYIYIWSPYYGPHSTDNIIFHFILISLRSQIVYSNLFRVYFYHVVQHFRMEGTFPVLLVIRKKA